MKIALDEPIKPSVGRKLQSEPCVVCGIEVFMMRKTRKHVKPLGPRCWECDMKQKKMQMKEWDDRRMEDFKRL